jgi:multicomponent Na+:H+ antiporter subunit B
MNPILLQTIARTIGPVLILFSLVLLLRGHNSPGGGFVGGLMAASALTLYAMAYGMRLTERAIRVAPERLTAVGLLIAGASGVFPMLLGDPFLTAHWVDVSVPGMKLHVGTPLVFDVGVYLVVLGATLTFVLYLRKEPE